MKCLNCGGETDNPKFCSRSCSAIYTNSHAPKRKRIVRLCKCGSTLKRGQSVCSYCSKVGRDITLAQAIYTQHHRSSAYALVRTRARAAMKDEPQVCCECGYSKHVEVAHIRDVSSFPDDTNLSVINAKSNLKLLCPNCHWEFDHAKS